MQEEFQEAHQVGEAMVRYGGSFTKYLGRALLRADIHNLRKIKETWPEDYETYLSLYKMDNQ